VILKSSSVNYKVSFNVAEKSARYWTTRKKTRDLFKVADFAKDEIKKYANRIIETSPEGNYPVPSDLLLLPNLKHSNPNLIVKQFIFDKDFTIDVIYSTLNLNSRDVSERAKVLAARFEERFKRIFNLDESKAKFGKFALSNLLGGIR
jgi:hypothetical protein